MKKKTAVTPEEHIHMKRKTEDIIPEEKNREKDTPEEHTH